MEKSVFVSIETVNGIVDFVEGNIHRQRTGYRIMIDGAPEFRGRRITEVLNECAKAGYEHMVTETIGNRMVYRLKLRA